MTTTAQRRRRSIHSCAECRRRKVKCDNSQPCNHCVASGRPAACVYCTNIIQEPPGRLAGALVQQGSDVASHPSPSASPQTDEEIARNSRGRDDPRPGPAAAAADAAARRGLLSRNEFERNDGLVSIPRLSRRPNESPNEDLRRRLETLENLLPTSIYGRPTPASSRPPNTTPDDTRAALNKSTAYGLSHWATSTSEVSYRFK